MSDKKIPLYDFESTPKTKSNNEKKHHDDSDTPEVGYAITPKGILFMALGPDEANKAIAALSVHMKQFYSDRGFPALILENGQLHFVTITKG